MSIYLDYAATTPVDERVIAKMVDCMRLANPSAAYASAGAARREMRLARRAIADTLGVDQAGVVFTSGGSEANAWAMTAGQRIAVSAIEHASVLSAAPQAIRIPADENGVITPRAVEQTLRPDTQLVSVMLANNETGAVQPIEEIYQLLRKRGVLLHVDAVQAFGHIPVDARHCDLMTLSAHKLYGPRGAGCLYIRPGVRMTPLIPGGGQEMALRGGTENVPAIAGFGVAAQLAQEDMSARAVLEKALLSRLIDSVQIPGMRVLGEHAPRLPNVLALYLPGVESETAIARLDLLGVEVSGGAACHSRAANASHVYRAMGLSETEARHVLRVSVGRGVTEAMTGQAAKAIRQVYGDTQNAQ